jgi:WD40 repeat protein
MLKRTRLLVFVVLTALIGTFPATAQDGRKRPVITSANAAQVTRLAILGRGALQTLTWSPDGKALAVASTAGVWLYDATDFDAAPRLLEVRSTPQSIAYSPDGTLLATGGRLSIVRVWRVSDLLDATLPRVDPALELECRPSDWWRKVTGLAFSPDGATLACATDGVMLWDVATGESLAVFTGDAGFHGDTSVAFSPDGTTLATTGTSSSTQHAIQSREAVRLWDARTYELLASPLLGTEHDPGGGVAYSPDGSLLAVGTVRGQMFVWDTETGAERHRLEHYGGTRLITFSPDGSVLASADYDIRRWDVTSGDVLPDLEHGPDDVFSGCFGEDSGEDWKPCPYTGGTLGMAYSPDGSRLAAGDGIGQVYVWDATTGELLTTLEGFRFGGVECGGASCDIVTITGVTLSPDGTTIAAGTGGYITEGGWVELWDIETGAIRGYLEGSGSMSDLAYSPDGTLLATTSASSGFRLWDVAAGEVRHTLDGAYEDVEDIAFSPDGNLLAAGRWDGTVQVWNTATGGQQAVWEGHTDYVSAVAFSPDGSLLASGGLDATVRLWDVTTGETLAVFDGLAGWVHAVTFSPDGRLLAAGGGEDGANVRLWSISREGRVITGTELATFEMDAYTVTNVAFSPDGTVLVIGISDGTLHLRDAATRELLAVLEGHTGLSDVVLSADGTLLVSSGGGTIRLWGVR